MHYTGKIFHFPESDPVCSPNFTKNQDKSSSEKKTRIVLTTPKSACSIRTIPIPDPLIKILNDHQTSSRGFLLTNSETRFIEPRTMQNKFKTALKKSEIESANFHALRHTFATRCVELGFDVKSLSEILGHATINITMNRYVHPTLEMKKKQYGKVISTIHRQLNRQHRSNSRYFRGLGGVFP